MFLLVTYCGYSQDTIPKIQGTQKKIDLGLGGIGFTLEQRLVESLTLNMSVGFGGAYYITESTFDYILNPLKPALYVGINPRFFYNQKKRMSGNKKTTFNTGNYWGVKIKYASKSISSDIYSYNVLLYNAHWGMQRAIGERFLFNFHSGVGYGGNISTKYDTVYPAVDLKFSYTF